MVADAIDDNAAFAALDLRERQHPSIIHPCRRVGVDIACLPACVRPGG